MSNNHFQEGEEWSPSLKPSNKSSWFIFQFFIGIVSQVVNSNAHLHEPKTLRRCCVQVLTRSNGGVSGGPIIGPPGGRHAQLDPRQTDTNKSPPPQIRRCWKRKEWQTGSSMLMGNPSSQPPTKNPHDGQGETLAVDCACTIKHVWISFHFLKLSLTCLIPSWLGERTLILSCCWAPSLFDTYM